MEWNLPKSVWNQLVELGSFEREFRPRGFFPSVVLCFSLIMAGILLWLPIFFVGPFKNGLWHIWSFMATCALILVGSGCFICVRAFRTCSKRVLVFSDGVVYCHGKQMDVYRWDEIQGVQRQEHKELWDGIFHGIYQFTVQSSKGATLKREVQIASTVSLLD